MNSRLEQREYFGFMSTVGESSLGDITLTNPDNGKDNRVKAEVHRYKVTRSYNYAYMCLNCKKQHSVLNPDNMLNQVQRAHHGESELFGDRATIQA